MSLCETVSATILAALSPLIASLVMIAYRNVYRRCHDAYWTDARVMQQVIDSLDRAQINLLLQFYDRKTSELPIKQEFEDMFGQLALLGVLRIKGSIAYFPSVSRKCFEQVLENAGYGPPRKRIGHWV